MTVRCTEQSTHSVFEIGDLTDAPSSGQSSDGKVVLLFQYYHGIRTPTTKPIDFPLIQAVPAYNQFVLRMVFYHRHCTMSSIFRSYVLLVVKKNPDFPQDFFAKNRVFISGFRQAIHRLGVKATGSSQIINQMKGPKLPAEFFASLAHALTREQYTCSTIKLVRFTKCRALFIYIFNKLI